MSLPSYFGWTIGLTPAPLASGEVSMWEIQAMAGAFRTVAGTVAITIPLGSTAASARPRLRSSPARRAPSSFWPGELG